MLKSFVCAFSLFFLATSFAQAANLVGVNDSYGIPASKVITVEAFGVLKNDTLDGINAGEAGVATTLLTNVTQGVLTCPNNAGLALCADGSFEYTAAASFNGEDSFQYQAVAATGEIATATVTLGACSGGPTIFSCWHENSYRNKLTALGYNFFREGFESAAWDKVRSPDFGAAVTAPGVTSKNIFWTTNHPQTNGMSTVSGAARFGQWGGFDPAHGLATGTTFDCDVDNPPISCRPHDGLSGSGTALNGVGGYFSGTTGANIAIILDGTNQINGGRLSGPGHHFFAVIDTAAAGFTDFEFRELDGKVGQELFIFADDFIIATSDAIPTNYPPVLDPVGNKSVNENIPLSILLMAIDEDGDNLSFAVDTLPLGSSFVDHNNGTATFSWAPTFEQAGSYPLNFTVVDNGSPILSDTEAVTITVVDVVPDVTPPVITLLGTNPVNIELGASYIDAGATALDNVDGDISPSITSVSNVNSNIVGSYSVTYNVSDVAGNVTQVVRAVNVTADVTRPVITLLGVTSINIELGSTYVDAGAMAIDNIDGPLAVITNNPVNTNLVGSYIITYDAMDAAGNMAVQITRTVNVTVDVTKPVITLLGNSPVSVELGSTYIDMGATALDNIDGDISASITPTSTVTTNMVGSYTVTYNVSDMAGNAAMPVVRTVNVTADITKPVITLLGSSPVNIELGTAYVDAGATASDNIDGDISTSITPTSTVNTNMVGNYTVTYNVSDTAGNAATPVVRTVNVTADITKPVITRLGISPVNIELGAAYVDAGATALDNTDGVLAVTVSNSVNINLVGSYNIAYDATDAAGNKAAQVTRTVNVTADVTKPVITLLGNTPINIELGSTYVDAGATALDNTDGVLAVTVNNPVNINLVGNYVITYDAIDAAGNTAVQITRTVNVNNVTGLPGSLQFSSPVYSVAEDGLSALITVTRVNGSFGAVSVDYADVAGGSAMPGSDYTAMNGTLNFADGVTSQVISINVIDDAVYEGNETVNLLLSNVSGASLGMPSSAVLTIAENESVPPSGSLQFSSPVYSEKENGGPVTITVTRVGGSFGSAGLDYASADISATADSDYTTASGRLSFTDGELSQTFSVELIDDASYEGDETLSLTLSNPTGGAGLGAPALATLTISENDPVPPSGSLQFSAAAYNVTENGSVTTITVTRVGGSFGEVSVDYASVDGSASAGSDYIAVSGRLSFVDGEMSQIFSVELIDDANYEGDETLGLTLSNSTGGAGLGAPAFTILTISENDPVPPSGSLQFSAAAYNVTENGTSATITVTRVGGSFGTVSVDYASADNDAMAGSDYIAVSGNLSFADGEVSKIFSIDIVDDADYEGDETLSLTLNNPVGGAGLGAPALAILTISENDPVPPSGSLQFSAASYSVAENGATATITVSRIGGSFGLVNVDYASADGSAVAGNDYTAVSGSLSFADGEVSQSFNVAILDDITYEGDETLNLTLSNPSGGAGLSAPDTASLVVVENERSVPVDTNVSTGGGGGGSIELITLLFLFFRNAFIKLCLSSPMRLR